MTPINPGKSKKLYNTGRTKNIRSCQRKRNIYDSSPSEHSITSIRFNIGPEGQSSSSNSVKSLKKFSQRSQRHPIQFDNENQHHKKCVRDNKQHHFHVVIPMDKSLKSTSKQNIATQTEVKKFILKKNISTQTGFEKVGHHSFMKEDGSPSNFEKLDSTKSSINEQTVKELNERYSDDRIMKSYNEQQSKRKRKHPIFGVLLKPVQ